MMVFRLRVEQAVGSAVRPSAACVAVAVMDGAQQPRIVRLGAAAERERNDVIDLQQMPEAATAPAASVHVAAAPRSRSQTCRLTAAGMARPRTRACDAGGAACRAHSAFGAEVADRTAASDRFAGTARPQSADAFAGEGAPPAGAVCRRAGSAVAPSGPVVLPAAPVIEHATGSRPPRWCAPGTGR